jgi:small subunit ribosomal protein S16
MAVKIRLQRHGRKQNPYYKIVVADARSPRDGKFIERLGFYNPMTVPATIEIDRQKSLDWILKGAQPTDTVRAILRFKGVLFRKHLLRGVAKGAMTQEQADAKWADFIREKETKVEARRTKVAEEKIAYHANMSGTPKAAPVVEQAPAPVVEEAPAPVVEEAPAPVMEDAVEPAAEATEAPAAEAAAEPVVESPAEEPAAEAAPETPAEEAAESEEPIEG